MVLPRPAWNTSGSPAKISLIAAGSLTAGAVLLGLERTRAGAAIRAAVENRGMAESVGLRTSRIFTATFALGGGLKRSRPRRSRDPARRNGGETLLQERVDLRGGQVDPGSGGHVDILGPGEAEVERDAAVARAAGCVMIGDLLQRQP